MSQFDDATDAYPAFEDGDDAMDYEDDFDPNRCPACGAELVFGVCIMSDCMWTEADDE